MSSLKKSLLLLATVTVLAQSMPVPDTQVNFDAETIDLEDYDDLLAVENQIDKALVAIAPPPEGFPGERLVAKIAPAPKDFGGERLTSGTKESNDVDSSHGTYSFSFETENGMKRSEAGHMSSGGMVQTGSWEYVGPDGQIYKVEYIADRNGFRPTGDHLPTPPALPPALQRFEDAKRGQLSRGVASAAVLDTRQSREFEEIRQNREFAEFLQPMLIEFGPKSPKRSTRGFYPYYY